MSWTSAICDPCWDTHHPDREPTRIREPDEETCGRCGTRTRSGIYERLEPRLQVKPCPACGQPMTKGGVAIVCGPRDSGALPLPDYCSSRDCQRARDQAAIDRAVAAGVIDP